MSKLSKTYQEQINLFLKHLFKFLYGAKIGILGLNGSGNHPY
jgi:ATPase subunit of ABC transporter with duplicated ATPase domains